LKSSYTVPCDDYVHVVEFSPFDSGNQYVVVGTCCFQEEDMEVEGVEFTTLRFFHHVLRMDCLAWSPESRLDNLPQLIRFCTAAADRKVRLLTSDLQNQHEVKVMEGHTSYINHLVFEPTEGKQMASVSDDHTCRSASACAVLRVISSPHTGGGWTPEAIFKEGTIRFYDLVTQQAILSLDCGQSPLMSADWCLANTIKVGAVTGSDWVICDITRSSYPQEKRWSRISSQLLVHHLGHPQPVMIGSATVGAGLNWQRSLPLCVIGGDRKLTFWMTEM
uniref:Nucleoporin 37 n=1 Tax=Oncorhynchus kisutch TaxID=8019 RepID=A0A8C7KXC1_ONCKI